jgi:hypothetical protein
LWCSTEGLRERGNGGRDRDRDRGGNREREGTGEETETETEVGTEEGGRWVRMGMKEAMSVGRVQCTKIGVKM